MCFQGLKANIVPMIIPDSQVYNKFTKVLIRVPSRSPIHAKSESSIDEDKIFSRFHRQSSGERVEIYAI